MHASHVEAWKVTLPLTPVLGGAVAYSVARKTGICTLRFKFCIMLPDLRSESLGSCRLPSIELVTLGMLILGIVFLLVSFPIQRHYLPDDASAKIRKSWKYPNIFICFFLACYLIQAGLLILGYPMAICCLQVSYSSLARYLSLS